MFGLSPTAILHWVYGLAIAGLLVIGAIAWHKHDLNEQAIGKQLVEAAIKTENERLTAQNAKENAAKEAADAKQVAQEKAEYEKRLADSNALTNSLNARLRQLQANSAGRGVTVPGQAGSVPGANDASGVPSGVELALEGVVTAAGHDANKIAGLQDYISNVCLKPN